MGRIKTLDLTPVQQEALNQGLRNRNTYAFKRCQLVFLKEQGSTGIATVYWSSFQAAILIAFH